MVKPARIKTNDLSMLTTTSQMMATTKLPRRSLAVLKSRRESVIKVAINAFENAFHSTEKLFAIAWILVWRVGLFMLL